MKKALPAIFVFAALIPPLAGVFAQNVADLQQRIADTQRQRDALLEERAKIQSQIDAAEKQGQNLQGTINVLEASRKKIDNNLKVTQSSIDAANLTIQKLALTITDKQNQVDVDHQAIAESLKKLSTYDSTSLLTTFLISPNIAETWADQAKLDTLQANLKNQIADLRDAEVDLNQQKTEREQTKANLSNLKSQLSGQKQVVVATRNAQSTLLSETKNQEAGYQKLLADNIAREKQFEDQLFQFESQLKSSGTVAPNAKHGLLSSFPVSTIKITQQFGKTADAVRLYASGTHSGTDFGTPVGTPVMAAGNGVVAGMGNTDDEKGCYSYGRWLFINYTNGLSSIYGHLTSITVKNGDQVTAGQIVAYSGGVPGAYGSGYSTGPHLHMGLFNTAGVSIQQYTASIGCKNVSIPLANPSDYLDPLAYLPAL